MVFPVLIITLTRHGMACKHGISISPILTYQVCFHPLLLCFEMLHPVPWPSVSRKFQLASNGYTDKTPSTSSQTYQQLILSIAFHPSEVSRSSFNTKAETFGYPPPFFFFLFSFFAYYQYFGKSRNQAKCHYSVPDTQSKALPIHEIRTRLILKNSSRLGNKEEKAISSLLVGDFSFSNKHTSNN